jgi:hypothetical protein
MIKFKNGLLLLFFALLSNLTFAQNVKLSAKTFIGFVNQSTLLMDNYLTTSSNFPLSDPYKSPPFLGSYNYFSVNDTTLATIPASALTATGSSAIVDWVFVQLRTTTASSFPGAIVSTRAGLLLRSGIIVDVDVLSPLQFSNTPPGNYFVTIRHRNHLGIRASSPIALSSIATVMDFTNNSIPLYGTNSHVIVNPTLSMMIGGDANADGSIDSMDLGAWESQNGNFDDYLLGADYNMDGAVDGADYAICEINNGKYAEL